VQSSADVIIETDQLAIHPLGTELRALQPALFGRVLGALALLVPGLRMTSGVQVSLGP
jgi:hypothetical protein